jgi:hypothetical protein
MSIDGSLNQFHINLRLFGAKMLRMEYSLHDGKKIGIFVRTRPFFFHHEAGATVIKYRSMSCGNESVMHSQRTKLAFISAAGSEPIRVESTE